MESIAPFRLIDTTSSSSAKSIVETTTTTTNEVITHPPPIISRHINSSHKSPTKSNHDPSVRHSALVENDNKNNQSQTSQVSNETMNQHQYPPPQLPQPHRFVRSNRSSSSMVSGSSEDSFYPRRNDLLVATRCTDDNSNVFSPRRDESDAFFVVSNHHSSKTTTIIPNNINNNTTTSSTQDIVANDAISEDPTSEANNDESEEISSTNVTHGTIQKIDAQSVRRIVAGQAVTDLASAVKELVDNALDAASQTINIRLFNRGINIIEVTDDGIGVPVESRKFLATPHATSKIRTFEDIYHCPDDSDDDEDDCKDDKDDDTNDNGAAADEDEDDDDDELPSSSLATLGFRGEALFCLANLSGNLMISTRTANEELAEQMEFRKDGSLNTAAGVKYVPRKVGTSVAIIRLFESIPVRRKDMIRRIRYQRAKLIEMMEGYAIFSTGVQIHVMDMVENASDPSCHDSKSLLQTTANNRTLQETISSILGSKFLQTLSPIEIDLTDIMSNNPTTTTDSESQQKPKHTKKNKYKYKIHGLISKASVTTTTKGVRQAQFFAINRRPVDLPKVVRLINETWRLFLASNNTNSMSSAPSCVIQFTIPNNAYDINLAPDKRQVLFTNEAETYKALREGLLQLWKSQTEGQFAINNPKGLEFVESRRTNDVNGYLQGKSIMEDEALDINDDERINADVDDPKIDLLFDQTLPENTIATTANDKSIDVDQEEFIASRRYGFSDDPTLASHREMEDRIKLKKYLLTKPKQQQDEEGQVTAAENMEVEQIMTPPTPSREGTDVMSVTADAHGNSPNRKLITPSPAQVPLATSPSNSCSRDDEKLQFDGSTDWDSTSDKISSCSSPYRQCNGQKESRISISERKQWHHITAKFNRSDDIESSLLRMKVINDKFTIVNHIAQKSEPAIVVEGAKVSLHEGNQAIGLRQTDDKVVSCDSTAAKSLDVTRKRKTVSGLEKFGYKVFKKGYDESISAERKMVPLIQKEQPEKGNVQKSVSEATNPILQDKRFEVSLPKTVVPERSAKSAPPVGNNSLSELDTSDMTDMHGDSKTGDANPVIEAISQESTYVPKTATWKSFTSTEDVVNAAIQARVAMRERRKKLRKNSSVDFQPMFHKKGHKGVDERSEQRDVITKSNEMDEEPSENKVAESITLSKTDFKEMKIVGQFNLGFILATTADGNLWILDQHACDEKYNFEKLCRETVIHEQRLIAPMPLELSPTEETCILDNMDIFEKNGFRFAYDPNKEVRHRLSLTALPHSGARDGRKAVQFGKEDVAALCEILNASNDDYASSSGFGGGTGVDGSGSFGNNAVKRHAVRSLSSSIHGGDDTDRLVARLPKAIAMFASRACRGSVMIGKALSEPEMDRIVKHLAEIDNPWNCPHGRPTMRHVADLKPSLDKDEKSAAAYIAASTLSILSQDEEGES